MGHNTGRAIVEYKNEAYADEAVKAFNNHAVDDMVNLVKPVYEKGEQRPRKDENLLARRVYLMNVPYDTHQSEIQRLVQDFAEVDQVVLPRDP